jgi:hypothetical protein
MKTKSMIGEWGMGAARRAVQVHGQTELNFEESETDSRNVQITGSYLITLPAEPSMKTSFYQKSILRFAFAIGFGGLLLQTTGLLHAQSLKMNLPPGNYATQIGTRTLADPSGATHTRQIVKNKVVVGIFTAPNMSQGGTQEKWANLLANQPDTKISDKVALFLVEDMSQAGMFKGMALNSMKKEFTPTSRPFLILDEDGSVLKRFGVERGTTQILIYDKKGMLRDVEEDLENESTVIARIKAITKKLLAE